MSQEIDGIVLENTEEEVVYVHSRDIAENFEKQHKNILQSIERLKKNEHLAENSAQYFIDSEYKDSSGKVNKEYLITRDGFSLLVMGFTGQKAFEWKLKYIEAFNRLEQMIRDRHFHDLLEFEKADRKMLMLESEVTKMESQAKLTALRLKQMQSYGIKKTEASLMIQYAYMHNQNLDEMISGYLREKHAKEILVKRNRIYVRVQKLGAMYKELGYRTVNENSFELAWHRFAAEMKMDLGHVKSWQEKHAMDKRATAIYNENAPRGKKKKCPGYLEYVVADGCFKEAELAANRLIKRAEKDLTKRREHKHLEEIVDRIRED